jgi:hypothetical protein
MTYEPVIRLSYTKFNIFNEFDVYSGNFVNRIIILTKWVKTLLIILEIFA